MSSHRGIVSPDYYEVLRPIGKTLMPRHAHHALRAPFMRADYASRSKGIRPAQWRLHWESLGDVELGVPALDVQQSVADLIDRQTSKIDRLSTECRELTKLLKERRFALITAAVTGKIDVRT